MFPDYGHEWPLWEDDHDEYTMVPSDYGLSADLTRRLRLWYDEWERGFDPSSLPPRWKPGQGRRWSERGLELANALREEVKDFADVEYYGKPY
jgi:hypothetical protein